MKIRQIAALAILACLLLIPVEAVADETAGVVEVKDPALEAFIRREIGKPEGVLLTEDVAGIRSIDTTT